ncbi:MAG: hypothetical protein WCO12_00135 [bacterium]
MVAVNDSRNKYPFFALILFTFVFLTLSFNFYRYFVKTDYVISIHVECDQLIESCITDGSIYYNKYLLKMTDFIDVCGEREDLNCVEKLLPENKIQKMICGFDTEDWESCTEPTGPKKSN